MYDSFSDQGRYSQAGGFGRPAAAPQLSQYAEQLKILQGNPSTVSSMPGYEAGRQAVERSMAAQGYQGSGNMAASMAEFGSDFYLKQLQTLGNLESQRVSGEAQMGQLGIQAGQLGLESQKMQMAGGQWDANRADELAAGEEYRRMMEMFSRPVDYSQFQMPNVQEYSGYPQQDFNYPEF